MKKKFNSEFLQKNLLKIITRKISVVEHSAWRQMKENYQIYLPYQFHWRAHLVGGDPQLSHKKMKTLFLSNMSKSRRLTSTFFPINLASHCEQKMNEIDNLWMITFIIVDFHEQVCHCLFKYRISNCCLSKETSEQKKKQGH